MMSLRVLFVKKSTRRPLGSRNQPILHELREDVFASSNVLVMYPQLKQCMLWKMFFVLWLLVKNENINLDNTNFGKQIFFDIFLDTPPLKKKGNLILCAKRIVVYVKFPVLVQWEWARSSQPFFAMDHLWQRRCTQMGPWMCFVFLIIARMISIHFINIKKADHLQHFYRATTNNVILLKCIWMKVGIWTEITCHGRFLLDVLKDTPQE